MYDEAIGVKGATAGLIDPTAMLNVPRGVMPPPPPPRTPASKAVVSEKSASKLWACQKCGEKNPEHTQFCYNCGAQLVCECPKCHKNTSLVATGFCGSCGANYGETLKRIELRTQLTKELNKAKGQQVALSQSASSFESQAKVIRRRIYDNVFYVVPAIFFTSIGILLGLLAFSSNLFLIPFALGSFLLGVALIFFENAAKKKFNERRDTEARAMEEQAIEQKNQANALNTPIMKLREQLKELAE